MTRRLFQYLTQTTVFPETAGHMWHSCGVGIIGRMGFRPQVETTTQKVSGKFGTQLAESLSTQKHDG